MSVENTNATKHSFGFKNKLLKLSNTSNISRINKKVTIFFSLQILLFALLCLSSIFFFQLNIFFFLISLVLYVAITNIFFIIVIKRVYLGFLVLAQFLVFILFNSLIGQAFNFVTIFASILATLLVLFAYFELEKIQLGTRVFSISLVCNESNRVLTNLVVLIVSVCIFNSVSYTGNTHFFENHIYTNRIIRNNLILGKGNLPSLNNLFLSRYVDYDGTRKDTFYDFLVQYHQPGPILTKSESDNLTLIEQQTKKEQKAEDYRQRDFKDLPYTLDTVMTEGIFENITKKYYANQIKKLSSKQKDSSLIFDNLIFLNQENIFPATIAIFIYVVGFICRSFINFITLLLTMLFWRLLKMFGFVQIEVEAVEAEVASI